MLMLLKCIVKMTDRLHFFSLAKCADGPLAGEGERKGGRSGRLPYLHAGLGQVDLHGQLFPGEDVRVVSLGEDRLQRLQLRGDKQRRRAGLPGGPPTDPGPTAAPARKDGAGRYLLEREGGPVPTLLPTEEAVLEVRGGRPAEGRGA